VRLGRSRPPAPGLPERLDALRDAVELADGRLPDASLAKAHGVLDRAAGRLAMTGSHTVVALAGATGSGKSSLFNALSRTDLAIVGVRRPTTSTALAAVWGDESAEALLDWLQVPRRHGVKVPEAALAGLVLLDLPDHDSYEVAHRAETDRLVQLVDLLVWVVDPQKYADAALHERYLAPLATHAGSMLVVLNQVDRVGAAERAAVVADLVRLLATEGLGRVDVLAVSATTGEGVDALRSRLGRVVADKQAVAARLGADVTAATHELQRDAGAGEAAVLSEAAATRLTTALGAAAGIPVVAEAVAGSWRHRGVLATGWPVVSWLRNLRPDPLRRLRLHRLMPTRKDRRRELTAGRTGPEAATRSAVRVAGGVQQAQVSTALRALADEAAAGLPRGWADRVRQAARQASPDLPDRLDRAIAHADLGLERHRRWWGVARVLQWLLIACLVAGLGWLAVDLVLAYLRLPPLPELWSLPIGGGYAIGLSTLVPVGGALVGVVLGGLCRIGIEVGARRRARQTRARLTAAVRDVVEAEVMTPVRAELDRYGELKRQLAIAAG